MTVWFWIFFYVVMLSLAVSSFLVRSVIDAKRSLAEVPANRLSLKQDWKRTLRFRAICLGVTCASGIAAAVASLIVLR